MKHLDMAVIVPSRSRPDNIKLLVESFIETSAQSDLVIGLDDDDYQHYEVLDCPPGFHIIYNVDVRIRMGPTLNRIALDYATRYRYLGFMGDDHRPRTPGWDQRIIETLEAMGTGIVYGDDLYRGGELATAVFMTSNIVETLGYMVPPGLIHLYIDNAWMALGTGAGVLRYLPEVVVEHMHPAVSKAPWDAGYEEVNSVAMYASDEATYQAWVQHGLPEATEKLKQLIHG